MQYESAIANSEVQKQWFLHLVQLLSHNRQYEFNIFNALSPQLNCINFYVSVMGQFRANNEMEKQLMVTGDSNHDFVRDQGEGWVFEEQSWAEDLQLVNKYVRKSFNLLLIVWSSDVEVSFDPHVLVRVTGWSRSENPKREKPDSVWTGLQFIVR